MCYTFQRSIYLILKKVNFPKIRVEMFQVLDYAIFSRKYVKSGELQKN